jgi:Bacterial Ig-like domain (group 2)
MSQWQLVRASFVLALLLASPSCTSSPLAPPSSGQATMHLTADVSGTTVARIVVEVTAPDIVTPLVFNITITGGAVSGTITVPSGSDRTITMRAYDAGGVETHSGSVTIAVQPATNPTIAVVLVPLTGNVPINATLGSLTVSVTPSVRSLSVGDTATLTAVIKDANGNPAVGTVAWATRNPGVAVVDTNGLVKATGVGSTSVSATFSGATGVVAVTVTP